MTKEEKIKELSAQYQIHCVVDLDPWHDLKEHEKKDWLRQQLERAHKDPYADNERVIFTLTRGDVYTDQNTVVGSLLEQFQRRLNEIDISNFFVILLTNDVTIIDAYSQAHKSISKDTVPITIELYQAEITNKTIKKDFKPRTNTEYYSVEPLKIGMEELTEREQFLLTKSKTFCMYPWMHFHAYPTGSAYPCCMADMEFPIGDMRKNSMKEIWNQLPMREMRKGMLNEKSINACNRCYEQEVAGFMSGRMSANKHHGHHIRRVSETAEDGHLERFEMTYWDIRFSNLCNLSCRSCGHIFSSSWYQDQAKLAGPEWKKNNRVLNYAGKFETDAWDQLVEHIDHVEQIYFAGGEPLLMDEHYKILEELVRRKKFDVRLIYNTNFTHTQLKDRSVFDYWKLFDSVSVGASLDAQGPRAEYIRKGTDWAVVEENRRQMIAICPQVDFYISPTLSIMNALHLPDFHREWVEKELIRAQDLNVNILQDPPYYRIDIATEEYKDQIEKKFRDHLAWLQPQDPLRRASVGFESALTFMRTTDNTHLIPKFWAKTQELDQIRNENILETIPELSKLK